MLEIKEFYTELHHTTATDTNVTDKGVFKIQQELERPSPIIFTSSNQETINFSLSIYGNCPSLHKVDGMVYIKPITANKNSISNGNFTNDDVILISNRFNLQLKDFKFMGREKVMADLSEVNTLYDSPAYLVYIETKINTFIVIYFQRWSYPNQPRGAAEDQYGEDITYVHGIWENPELPETILTKIKSR